MDKLGLGSRRSPFCLNGDAMDAFTRGGAVAHLLSMERKGEKKRVRLQYLSRARQNLYSGIVSGVLDCYLCSTISLFARYAQTIHDSQDFAGALLGLCWPKHQQPNASPRKQVCKCLVDSITRARILSRTVVILNSNKLLYF